MPSPPRMTWPVSEMVSLPPPLAGVIWATPSPPILTESRVCGVRPLLKTVAETTAGPVDVASGWVMTRAFWILMSPTLVAALSGLTSSVCALLLKAARGERGERERDGGGGESAASKAAAHGGGNSLNVGEAERLRCKAALRVCQRP